MYELEEAYEHLGDLLKEMSAKGCIDIESYSINIAHIYAHLNRGWHSRNLKGEMSDDIWEKYSHFPDDLTPLA